MDTLEQIKKTIRSKGKADQKYVKEFYPYGLRYLKEGDIYSIEVFNREYEVYRKTTASEKTLQWLNKESLSNKEPEAEGTLFFYKDNAFVRNYALVARILELDLL